MGNLKGANILESQRTLSLLTVNAFLVLQDHKKWSCAIFCSHTSEFSFSCQSLDFLLGDMGARDRSLALDRCFTHLIFFTSCLSMQLSFELLLSGLIDCPLLSCSRFF